MNSRSRYVLAGAVLVLVLLAGPSFAHSAMGNWARLVTASAWLDAFIPETQEAYLHDGIPDGWRASNWGKALAEFDLDSTTAFAGEASAYISKHTKSGYSVYSQEVEAVHDASLQCSIAHKGAVGFLQVRADGISGQTDMWLPNSDSWQISTWAFNTAPVSSVVTLTVGISDGSQGRLWIDDVQCSTSEMVAELPIHNHDFEVDGTIKNADYIQWWNTARGLPDGEQQRLTAAYGILSGTPDFNYLNAIDLLLGRSDRVSYRMQSAVQGCVDMRAAPNFLVALARYKPTVNVVQQEYLGRLGMELMPACPQSYILLSELYRSNYAVKQAAELLHEAVLHTPDIPVRGLYSFEEGALYSQYLGNYDKALAALREAEMYKGWEPSPWYFGVVQIYLGEVLTKLGRCAEAQAAFGSVLDCPECAARHAEAYNGIRQLDSCIIR